MRRGLTPLAALLATLPIAAIPIATIPVAAPAAAADATPAYLDTRFTFAERAADLVSRMTLEEKAAQLRTNSAPAIPRLGVQQYTYWNEAQHGVNRLGGNSAHGSVGGGVHATSFPTNFAASMSWDRDLVHQEASAISDEIRGLLDKSLWGVGQNNIGPLKTNYGNLTFWAPTVNLDRDPRWGRTDEAFGEDPYLTGTLADAYVNGYQGQTTAGVPTTPYLKVAATAKHFALNNIEGSRHSGSSETTETNLRDFYTSQFRTMIEDAHVSGLMTAYNAVNGTPAPVHTRLANEIAQRSWGFGGYSTSDCGAVTDVFGADRHNWAPPGWTTSTAGSTTTWTNTATGGQVSGPAGAQAYSLRAGTQLNCTGGEATLPNIEEAIRAGVLSEGVLDDALVRVFTVRMRTGEFDPADQVAFTKITKDEVNSPAHQGLAEQVAANSLVLLKNDAVPGSTAKLLPADPATLHNVVIVGGLAGAVTLGGYSGDPTVRVTPVQGITAAVTAANPDAVVHYDACGTSTTSTTPAACTPETLSAIAGADLVVVVVGTDDAVAGESHDRASLALPGNYASLVEQVTSRSEEAGNGRLALAIQAQGPVALEAFKDRFPAIVFSGYNGQSQGAALAAVLFGRQNPSGHLTFTWFKDDSQLPALDNYGLTPEQTGGLGRTYQYFTGTPSYPFGYGLSYTTFRYGRLDVRPGAAGVDVTFDVTNTGATAGATVPQLYAVPERVEAIGGQQQPAKRLRGFTKTRMLAPGESQTLRLSVPLADLASWNASTARQAVARGRYRFQVSADAATPVLERSVEIRHGLTPKTAYVTVQPGQVVLTPGRTIDLTGRNPWIADDTGRARSADRIVEAVRDDESFVDLRATRVRYTSSNPAVATVSRAGKVTTVAAGVTTIGVSVDGVTGSAPIVVQQPFAFEAPAVVQPGAGFTVTTTLPNPSGAPLSDVTLAVGAPAGWTAVPDGATSFGTVAAGSTVVTTWTVTAPATPGPADLVATATYTSANGPGSSPAVRHVSVPFDSLAEAFNNVATSDDANPTAGDIGGEGYSLSAQALAAGTPSITPGASVGSGGLTYTWPDAGPGRPDNLVAGGQTVPVTGTGSTLGLLGTATNGTASGTATITYTDGSTQAVTLSFADWWSNRAASGGAIVTTLPYLNTRTGARVHAVSVYSASVPLVAGKTVRYLTLPTISTGAVSGQNAMHIFAATLG